MARQTAPSLASAPGGRGGSADGVVHVFWLAGMSCDGCSVSALGASNPSMEDMVMGRIPVLPQVVFHHPMLAEDAGQHFMEPFRRAAEGTLGAPYVVVVEGSIPDDQTLEHAGQSDPTPKPAN